MFGRSRVGNQMMPSPKGSVRCAQLSVTIAGCAPARRQGRALHPALDILHGVPDIQRVQRAVIGRAEA